MSFVERIQRSALFARGRTRRSVVTTGTAGLAVAAFGSRMAPASSSLAQTPAATPSASPAATGNLIVRPNGATLSADQKLAFTNAVLALKKKPSPWIEGLSTYDTFVLWHRDAFNCDINAAHMGPAFFPWHRMYLHLFEQQLREVDPTVSIPYWDWTVDNTVDSYVWQPDLMGGDGSDDHGEAVIDGPFRKDAFELMVFDYADTTRTPYITRDLGFGKLAPSLPTAKEVEAGLRIPTYDAAPWDATAPIAESFRNTLEGWRDCVDTMCDPTSGLGAVCTGEHLLHNRVHLWVSGEFAFAHELMGHDMASGASTPVAQDNILGTMASNSSPNDPVFFLHHANMDRIWGAWLARHGQVYQPESGGPVGHNIDDAMWPYTQIGLHITPRMMLDHRALGYVYDDER